MHPVWNFSTEKELHLYITFVDFRDNEIWGRCRKMVFPGQFSIQESNPMEVADWADVPSYLHWCHTTLEQGDWLLQTNHIPGHLYVRFEHAHRVVDTEYKQPFISDAKLREYLKGYWSVDGNNVRVLWVMHAMACVERRLDSGSDWFLVDLESFTMWHINLHPSIGNETMSMLDWQWSEDCANFVLFVVCASVQTFWCIHVHRSPVIANTGAYLLQGDALPWDLSVLQQETLRVHRMENLHLQFARVPIQESRARAPARPSKIEDMPQYTHRQWIFRNAFHPVDWTSEVTPFRQFPGLFISTRRIVGHVLVPDQLDRQGLVLVREDSSKFQQWWHNHSVMERETCAMIDPIPPTRNVVGFHYLFVTAKAYLWMRQ
mgnify:FL=1